MLKGGDVSKRTQYSRLRRAREMGIGVSDLPDNRGKHCNHAKAEKHHRWNTEKLVDSKGYVLIRVGIDHPLADPNGYCPEHKLVMCSAMMRDLQGGEVIHHKNGDKTDNRIENLELMGISTHNSIHNAGRNRDEFGRFKAEHKNREWNEWPEVQE